jgi:Copper amine oxidase N-terminal domain
MKKANLSSKLLVSSLALSLLLGAAPQQASAADDAFINEIKKQYSDFEKKHQDIYDAYLKNERHLRDTYKKQMDSVYEELKKAAYADLDLLTSTLNEDIRQLKKQYKENSDEFRAYVRTTDKDRVNDPMDLYEDTMDPDVVNGPMDLFQDSLDPDSVNDAMDLYGDEIDPDSVNSALDLYGDDVDPDSVHSIMDLIGDESSIDSVHSIMDRYEDGDLKKGDASKQMTAAFAKAEEDMNGRINKTKQNVQSRKNESLRDIRDAWLNVRNSILNQREKTIAEVSEARKKLTGKGIEFKPLVLDNWITVVIDGDYLIFEQPPVSKNGYTLVPMRAVFEKLGAEVLWNANDQSVTAKKGTASIWLQLDNSTAKVNGKDQTLEVAPTKMNNNTMVPLRFVSEALGAKVEWDSKKQTIIITSAR